MKDRMDPRAEQLPRLTAAAQGRESLNAEGVYLVECIGRDGRMKWRDRIENTVMTEGKNALLDAALAGSSYSVTGPYMGLISSTSYSAISAADTGAQINGSNGWTEAGNAQNPQYSGNRKTCAWAAAASGAKALSAALSFAITADGTAKGAFILFGSSAVNTIDDAHGKLLSAGLFSGGDRALQSGDTLNVSYSLSL